ncbi:MAG: efflux transporter periplasmic adaptor subunit [Nevskia sp.]|nr:efflux transporter periplasmic adaptor subunit [Nevskia sp.]
MTLRIAIPLLAPMVLLLSHCNAASPDAAAPQPVAQVKVKAAEQKTMHEILTAYGSIDYAVSGTRSVVVQTEAQVTQVMVVSGQVVRRGSNLLRLQPTPTTQLELDKALRDSKLAIAEQARLTRMQAQGLATDGELAAGVANAEAATALSNSLAERQGAGIGWLRAPVDGVIEAFNALPGDILSAGTTVLRIGTANALVARIGIEPENVRRIAVGQRVELSAPKSADPPSIGMISSVDQRIDAQTHQITALVDLPMNTRLLPGALVRARVVVANHADVVIAPRSAVNYDAAEASVFVAENGHAKKRPVKLGISEGEDVEIVDGLKAGEPVVVQGAYELEDGMPLRTETDAVEGAAP